MHQCRSPRSIPSPVRALAGAACAALAAALTPFAAGGEPPIYGPPEVIHVGLGGSAINAGGDVVGTQTSPIRAWVSLDGSPSVLLPLPPGAASSWANDINDLGVVVGAAGPAYSPEFGGKAAVWTPDGKGGYSVQSLGSLPGHVASNAAAINNLGDIVGYSSNGTYRYPVLFTAPGGIQDLSSTGIFDPADINESRVLVDHSFTSKTLDLDTMEVMDLGTPGPGYLASTGAAINESGQVGGLVILTTSTSCDRQAARWTEEVGWEVFSICGPYNGAQDINDLGDLVESVNLVSYVRYEGLGTFVIENLIDADVGHWYVISLSPLAINNARQLVVTATNPALNQTAVLRLTPLGTPGDLDGNGVVDGADLGLMLGDWGPADGSPADIDGDGVVDGSDLGILLSAWGKTTR